MILNEEIMRVPNNRPFGPPSSFESDQVTQDSSHVIRPDSAIPGFEPAFNLRNSVIPISNHNVVTKGVNFSPESFRNVVNIFQVFFSYFNIILFLLLFLQVWLITQARPRFVFLYWLTKDAPHMVQSKQHRKLNQSKQYKIYLILPPCPQ